MLGTFVNTAAVIIGSFFGLLLKKGIPEKLSDIITKGLALCVLYIGISGCLKGTNPLITILSMVIGAVIGELIDLDKRLNQLGDLLGKRFNKGRGQLSVSQGFVTASLLFCVGSMTIVGSLQSGLTGNHEMLFTKSMLDLVSSVILASSLGIGVMLSAAFVLVFQGSITLLAAWVQPFLSDYAIAEMTCAGSLLIIALGLNMLGISKIKASNLLPAIFIPLILCLFM
jgi:uncharacterized membrane protein YqgA involved in biofilm formation